MNSTIHDASAISWLIWLLLGGLFLVTSVVWISTLVWVYRDAERCGKPGILVALLIGVLFWPVGLLVWLILRQDYLAKTLPPTAVPPPAPPSACPQCGRAMVPGSVQGLCPACLLRQAAFESGPPRPGMAGFTPPAPAELAELFPQFEILELLGKGGMGAVYKAKQTSLDRYVALKILPAEAAEDPAFGERFQREARALAQLSHPNIVGVHDFGQAGAYAYLVMEFVDGANLRQLQRAGHLSPQEALAIVPQICEALQFAHDRGIVHRDIKPENILIDTQGRVKIADFGLAKMMRLEAGAPDLTLTRHAIGTPQYMAPEQIEKPETVDHRADIYSLGVVFYEMLTGELPIGRFSSPSQRVQVDVRLDEVVLKALEKEPSLRYQQASAFKTRVETVAGGTAAESVSGTGAPTIGSQPPTRQPITAVPGSRHTDLFLIYTLIGYFGLGLSIACWPVNFFKAEQLLHWILPTVVVLSVGFVVAGGVIYSLGKGYGWGPGCVALLGPLGAAILFAMPNRAAAVMFCESQAANEPAGSPVQPKLCPTAIWGAVQAAIFLTLIPGCFLLQGNQRTTAILALVAVGCSTAICGAIAISQIRRSEGKLYGMGLAVFDLVVPVAIAAASVVFLF